MDINEEQRGDVLIVSPQGRVDSVSSGELEVKLLSCIDGGSHRMVIDFSGLDFVSSSGLRVFLMTAKKLKPLGGKVVLCSLAPEVKEVFEVSGFASMLSIKSNLDDAVAEF